MLPGESSCPGGSEYVCQKGVEGVLGRVTGGRSWPSFKKNKMKSAVYFGHLIILLTDRISSPSTDFRRPKHGQNCPAANFRPKGVCSPIYTGLFTYYGPSQYLSSFPSNGPKSKKIPFFSLISLSVRKKKCLARVRSILMLPTFHIASLNRYNPKFSGVP